MKDKTRRRWLRFSAAVPPSSALTGPDWIALDSFLFCLPTTCQICISGARPGGIRLKKDSLHIQNLILSSAPSLWASQPTATDAQRASESRPRRSPSSVWRAAPFLQRISCQSCLSGNFKWARRPGRRFWRRIRLHILTAEPSAAPPNTDAAEGKSHQKRFFFSFFMLMEWIDSVYIH